ncbi:MAG TPA: ABC transporter permease [Polyangiaceae bacterium]|jgi:simple sugar transport system permease protein|nr:MAG: Galactoside transport system permease protein MglC [Deltaproteobacteria bacterium ADurb.Bin207]HNS98860.1 ABC transporter permease [Polyangiaceae bacterium]HNZ23724.1 ABC transporter permease [Polyangiaceae bacterium]HOD24874.1 ABC transporter permease [Polyangiaceae bacterium]HOE48949.1 ABC transporter permease [Polyangiaceae bacterium]
MSQLLTLTFVAETIRLSIPFACAALAGVWSERSGVVHIALEGVLLSSAFGAVVATLASGSPAVGVLGGVLVGTLLSLLHGLLSARFRVDAIVSGIALNLLAASGTRFLLRAWFDSASNSPPIAGFHWGPTGSSGAAMLARTLLDPVTLLAVLAVAVTPWVLFRTRFGLRVRAAGENPVAAASVGIPVVRVRLIALCVSGAVGALGGIHLAFDQHRFESGMSGGRGFIALAAVILAGWRPVRAALACLVFAALEATQILLQGQRKLPPEILQMLPYLATLVVLALAAGKARAPAGLGQHATEER